MRPLLKLCVACVLVCMPRMALALGQGGEGNQKLRITHLPKGADVIVNRPERVAWWEGAGGPFHAEGRGNAAVMNKILEDFGKLDVKTKRIVVHDGVGQCSWIKKHKEDEINKAAEVDWGFAVWPIGGPWARAIPSRPENPHPQAQIDVYTANIPWADVVVPAGIEVIDERLETHGLSVSDGIVVGGHIKEPVGGKPLVATVRVQRIDTSKEQGYVYTDLAESKSNPDGNWVVKNLPPAWVRVVIEADGYVPRVVGHARFYNQPQWKSFDSELAPPVVITGRVTDQLGGPLPDVQVSLYDVITETGDKYESPSRYSCKTDSDGRFRSDQAPAGKAYVGLSKPGYHLGGPRKQISLPANDIQLQMGKARRIRVTVDFNDRNRPQNYIVELEPEGGNAIGKFGGSAQINAENTVTFKNVPLGKYTIKGHPNPTTFHDESDAVEINLEETSDADVTIKAK